MTFRSGSFLAGSRMRNDLKRSAARYTDEKIFSMPELSCGMAATAVLISCRSSVGCLVISLTSWPKAITLVNSGLSSCLLNAGLPAASMTPNSS